MTEDQISRAAINLCRMRELDPAELVPCDCGEPGCQQPPMSIAALMADEIRDFLEIRTAISMALD